MIDIGCCGNTNTYPAIAQMGYDYVELSARQIMELSDEEFEAFLGVYGQTGFPCHGFNDYCSAQHPLIGPESKNSDSLTYARALCRRGAALGISTIGIGAPAARIMPPGYGKERADADMTRFLQYICPMASKYGITILLEAVHSGLCNYLTGTDEVLAMVQALNLPNLKMVLDYYHAEVMGEDLHALHTVMPHVRHLHISTDLESHDRGFMREEDVPLMQTLLQEAAAAGYTGGISVEAVHGDLLREGAACAHWMRMALPEKEPMGSCCDEPWQTAF